MQRTIDGLCVTIIRKSIKNMHLRVLSPNGEIQITAPNRLPLPQIDRFVIRSGWKKPRAEEALCGAGRKSFYLSTRRMTHRSGNRF